MNSVLQSLFYSLSYREKVMGSSFVDESVGEKISWLFEEMEGSGYVDTSHVARALDLNPGTQEDAQEFFVRRIVGQSADPVQKRRRYRTVRARSFSPRDVRVLVSA